MSIRTTSRAMSRAAGAIATTGFLVLGVSACGGGDDESDGSDAPGTVQPAPAPTDDPEPDSEAASEADSAGDGAAAEPTSADGEGASGGDSPAGEDAGSDLGEQEDGAAEVGACTLENLDVVVGQGDGAAGSIGYELTFTNIGTDPCRIEGYPSVVAVGNDDGTEIGLPARESDEEGAPAVLIPNGTAVTTLIAVNIGDTGGPLDGCEPVPADGWRITPPGEDGGIFVEQDGLTACSADVDWLTVSPVHPSS